jgi:hypothetical protein
LSSRLYRATKRVANGEFIALNIAHIAALHKISHRLTADAKTKLKYFEQARYGNLFSRLFFLYRAGVYRQEVTGTIGLYMAALLKKI